MPRRLARPVLAFPLAVAAFVGACSGPAAAPPTARPEGASPSAPSVAPSDAASPSGVAGGASAAPGSPWLPEWSAGTDVPAEVASRRPLPFCGVEQAPAPQPGEFIDRAVRLCFWNAHLAGTEAEFASIQSTMEGGTIATIFRLAADGTVEVLTDFTQDPFGGGGWQSTLCRGLVEGEGPALLGVAECDEGRAIP